VRSKPRDQGILIRVIAGAIPNGSGSGFEWTAARLGVGDYTVRLMTPRRIQSVTASAATGALGYSAVAATTADPSVVSIKTFNTTTAAAADANCYFAIAVAET
jgi:hypothetical protein